MNQINLREYSPIIDIKGNRSITAHGDYVYSYQIDLPETYSVSEKMMDEIHEHWVDSLAGLPPGTIILKQDFVQKQQVSLDELPTEHYLQRATKDYYEDQYTYQLSVYLHIVNTSRRSIIKNQAIINPFKKIPDVKKFEEGFKEDEDYKQIVEAKIGSLNAKKVWNIIPITEDEIKHHAKKYFNGLIDNIQTDTNISTNTYYIGDRRVGAYVIRRNEQFNSSITNAVIDRDMSKVSTTYYKGYAEGLGIRLDCDHCYNQIFVIENSQKIRKLLEKRRIEFAGNAGFDKQNKIIASNIEKELEKLDSETGSALIRAHFNIIFYSESDDAYEKNKSKIATVFDEMKIRPYMPTGNNLANIVNNSFMANVSRLDYDNTFIMDIQHGVCMLNNVSHYKSDDEGPIFNDRIYNGAIKRMIWHTNKKYVTAPHFGITSYTGGGKSFLVNHLGRYFIDTNMRGVFNDCGDSLQQLTLLYPDKGVYIKFKEGHSLGVNPFRLYENQQLSTNKINEIAEFVILLWKRRQLTEDSDESIQQKVSLRKVIAAFYENVDAEYHHFPGFFTFVERNGTDIYDELDIKDEYFDLESFLHNCSEFVGNGAYAYLFENPDEALFDPIKTQFIVFEFGDALKDPLLLSVLTQLSASAADLLVWADRSQKSFIIYEEFAKLLKYEEIVTAVEFGAQTLRKFDSGIGIVLQSPSQLPETTSSNSIIGNIQTWWVLDDGEDYKYHRSKLNFNEHDIYQCQSLKSEFEIDRPYSEIYLKRGDHGNVVRLGVAKELYFAYQTEGSIHSKMMEQYEEIKDMKVVIQNLVNN